GRPIALETIFPTRGFAGFNAAGHSEGSAAESRNPVVIPLVPQRRCLDFARNDNRASITSDPPRLNWLPCNSSDNQIQSRAAADCSVETAPGVWADSVV